MSEASMSYQRRRG